jgi:hypothetical protein
MRADEVADACTGAADYTDRLCAAGGVAALAALPYLELVPLIGLIHAFHLVDAGAHPLLGVPHEESTQFTVVASVIAAGGLWAASAAAAAAGLL